MTMTLRVNGQSHEASADPDTPLIYVLRNELKLKGTKLGCGQELCGACAVLADGRPVLSCVSAVSAFEGVEITTVEGIGDNDTGRRVQNAFVDTSAAQCGYCTAGLVVAATGLLKKTRNPSRAEIVEALTPHLCRCGSHPRVIDAVERAAGER